MLNLIPFLPVLVGFWGNYIMLTLCMGPFETTCANIGTALVSPSMYSDLESTSFGVVPPAFQGLSLSKHQHIPFTNNTTLPLKARTHPDNIT